MAHALRSVDVGEEILTDLQVVIGYDDDLAGEVTRITNRIRGLLTHIHPALERALGPRLNQAAVRELLIRFGGPTELRAAGRPRLLAVAKPKAPRTYTRIVDDITNALDSQTVTAPGTTAAEKVLPLLASSLTDLLDQRDQTAATTEEMLDAHPLTQVLTSMPGITVKTGTRIPLEVGNGTAFPTSGHLATYTGTAPVTPRSGTSIRAEPPPRSGNKNLKRAFFLAAFTSLHDPASRAHYDHKRAQGKRHNAALICLAHHRIDVLHAMLRNDTPYEHRTPTTTPPITATAA